MGSAEQRKPVGILPDGTVAQFLGDAQVNEVRAWEEIDTGRYMPRRIKGSCKGRALG